MSEHITLGLDYAARHTEQQLRDAIKLGIRFVVRYLAPPYLYDAKAILHEEADMLASLGLGVVSVYQRRNTQIEDFDAEHAKLDAVWATDNAYLAGQKGGPIYFAMDFDVQPDQLPVLQAYLDEVTRLLKATPYEAGVYGSHRVVEELDVAHRWQTYAWSRGQVSKKARFLQCHNGVNLAGGSNDLNVAWGDPGCWIAPRDTSRPDDLSTYKRGWQGWQVSVLQGLLAREGYHTNGIDGVFGQGTDYAVKEYQAARGLDIDGIVGSRTWAALWPEAVVEPDVDEPVAGDPKDAEIRLLTEQVLALQAHRDSLQEAIDQIRGIVSRV